MLWLLLAIPGFGVIFHELYESRAFSSSYHNDPIGMSIGGWAMLLLISCAMTFVLLVALAGIATLIGKLSPKAYEPDEDYPLVALRQQDGVAGSSFFLGSGMINDQQYYFWYRKNSDGSISGGKSIRQPSVRIYETGKAPFMRTFKTKKTLMTEIFGVWLGIADKVSWTPNFHIPAGSIKEGFTL